MLSPGPCTPNEAGICLDLIKLADGRGPILAGVCLGHQAIGQVYGGTIVRAPEPMHGKLSKIHHTGKSVFRGLNNDFQATRYHSLTIAPESMPSVLEVTATSERRRDPGCDAQNAADSRRAIPSREHRIGKRSRAAPELSDTGEGRRAGMSSEEFSSLLKRVASGETLDTEQSARAFGAIMAGEVSEIRITALATAMAVRKPTVDEIVGAVRAMRGAMKSIEANPYAIDLCGTGGDGIGTLNISTANAFVVAACGVPVAKHGNRNMSSKSGTADCLEALGVNIDLSPEDASRCLREAGLCFLFAQVYHPAMKYAAPVRRELGFRTIFNLLGPLTNPARVRRQLVGVYDKEWCVPMAEALGKLGAQHAWVVHGDGMDEIALSAPTHVAVLENGKVTTRDIGPEDAGLSWAPQSALAGGAAQHNAAALRRLLEGETGAYRDIVLINSAAALIVAGRTDDLREGVKLAAEAIDSGAARAKLEKLIAVSRA